MLIWRKTSFLENVSNLYNWNYFSQLLKCFILVSWFIQNHFKYMFTWKKKSKMSNARDNMTVSLCSLSCLLGHNYNNEVIGTKTFFTHGPSWYFINNILLEISDCTSKPRYLPNQWGVGGLFKTCSSNNRLITKGKKR